MIHARKRFGQHFLHDRGVLERIVRELDPQPDQALVEIGPGRGALTERLVDRSRISTQWKSIATSRSSCANDLAREPDSRCTQPTR